MVLELLVVVLKLLLMVLELLVIVEPLELLVVELLVVMLILALKLIVGVILAVVVLDIFNKGIKMAHKIPPIIKTMHIKGNRKLRQKQREELTFSKIRIKH
jgi:hypothetical protein